jgi:methylmalonyl-CoA mutase N-terminal domain/subunit
MEKKIVEEMERVERLGGIVEAVKSGAIQADVARQAYRYERQLLSGEVAKVAVNRHVAPDAARAQPELELYSFDPRVYEAQVTRLAALRARRDGDAMTRALDRLRDEARGTGNLWGADHAGARLRHARRDATALKDGFGEHGSREVLTPVSFSVTR